MESTQIATQFDHMAYTVDLFGLDDVADKQGVISHTLCVLHNLETMHNSALKMSLHVYKLSQYFNPLDGGKWDIFCEKNFLPHGLSIQGIRAAIRIGKLAEKIEMTGRNFEHMSKLSRSALLALADSPPEIQSEVVNKVLGVIDVTASGVIPRAKDVEEIKNRLAEATRNSTLQEGIIKEKDSAILRLNTICKAKEEEANGLFDQVQNLQRKLSEVRAQEIVHVPDPKIKNSEEIINSLQQEISMRRDELARLDQEINEIKEEQNRMHSKVQKEMDAQRILASLEDDIKNMTFKYSEALVLKVKKTHPASEGVFERIASKLRVLADQLHETLV